MPGSSPVPRTGAVAGTSVGHPSSVQLLAWFDPDRLARDLERVAHLERIPQPGSYHDGDWVGLSLRAAGGRNSARPSMPGLRPYRETPVLRLTPGFRDVLGRLRFPMLAVRLLYLPPGAVIREHVDDMLGFWHGILRLHLPIRTHPDVDFRLGGVRESWCPGELWYGDFTLPHSIVNRSPVTRVHLVFDSLIDDSLLDLFPLAARERLSSETMTLHREPVALAAESLRELECDLSIPAKLLARLWPQLVRRLGAAPGQDLRGALRVRRGRLTLFLLGRPVVTLDPIGEDACTLVGWGPGVVLGFERSGGAVSSAMLRLRLASRELTVSLPVLPDREA